MGIAMDLGIDGKLAVVIGGAGEIGYCAARTLAFDERGSSRATPTSRSSPMPSPLYATTSGSMCSRRSPN